MPPHAVTWGGAQVEERSQSESWSVIQTHSVVADAGGTSKETGMELWQSKGKLKERRSLEARPGGYWLLGGPCV